MCVCVCASRLFGHVCVNEYKICFHTQSWWASLCIHSITISKRYSLLWYAFHHAHMNLGCERFSPLLGFLSLSLSCCRLSLRTYQFCVLGRTLTIWYHLFLQLVSYLIIFVNKSKWMVKCCSIKWSAAAATAVVAVLRKKNEQLPRNVGRTNVQCALNSSNLFYARIQ